MGSSLLGGILGTGAAGGSYEYHLKRQKDRVDEDLKAGKIDQKEYEDQITGDPRCSIGKTERLHHLCHRDELRSEMKRSMGACIALIANYPLQNWALSMSFPGKFKHSI